MIFPICSLENTIIFKSLFYPPSTLCLPACCLALAVYYCYAEAPTQQFAPPATPSAAPASRLPSDAHSPQEILELTHIEQMLESHMLQNSLHLNGGGPQEVTSPTSAGSQQSKLNQSPISPQWGTDTHHIFIMKHKLFIYLLHLFIFLFIDLFIYSLLHC